MNFMHANLFCVFPEYTLMKFRKSSGQPCLMDKDFNYHINSKCATVRRALNCGTPGSRQTKQLNYALTVTICVLIL